MLRDVAAKSGLRQTIVSGDPVTESLLDANGQGACFLDFDGDGFLDIYFANGSSKSRDRAGKPPQDHVFRSRGDGTFEEVTANLGLGHTNWSSGCVVGDYDGDGDPDLFVTNYGANKLLQERCGRLCRSLSRGGRCRSRLVSAQMEHGRLVRRRRQRWRPRPVRDQFLVAGSRGRRASCRPRTARAS